MMREIEGSKEVIPHTGLLDYSSAATVLGTTERHVRELWACRRIGAVKIGRLVRFRQEDLQAYIDAHFVPPVR